MLQPSPNWPMISHHYAYTVIIETSMESIDYEEEEQIYSEAHQHQKEVKHFKQYLVNSGTIHHFVKFLFGLRTKQEHDEGVPNSDALQMFQEYFGSLTPDTTQQDVLKSEISTLKTQNSSLSNEIKQITAQIQVRRERIEKAREQKRLREEQQAKNPKKGGKK